ncbi:hypothetical protein PtB15_2B709 [Puccinia triticina]|nr:hypothetical protein PtB15_2B709 [Puccinia triticina]
MGLADSNSIMEEVPSTPPNTTDHSHTVPESVTRRESSRIRTPMSRPGFIATQSDSRRALVPILPKPKQSRSTNHQVDVEEEHLELGSGGTSQLDSQAPTQVSSRTGQQVTVNLRQDSDDENRVANVRKADQSKDKDGFDHVSLYFWPLCEGPKQEEDPTGEDIIVVENPVSDGEEDIDPDDAEAATHVDELGWEENGHDENDTEDDKDGIGLTLKKASPCFPEFEIFKYYS